MRALPARQLHRVRADSTCCAMDQDMLPCFDISCINQCSPSSESTHWKRSCLFKSKTRWFGLYFVRLGQSVFRIPACINNAVDLLAVFPSSNILTNGFNDP